MPDLWGLASIISKFGLYFGALAAVGSVLVAVLFRVKISRGFTVGCAVLGLVASLLGFSLAGAALTGDVTGMTDPEMLGLLWSTSVGTALLLRIIGFGLLIGGLFMGRAGLCISLIGCALTLWAFVLTGHIPDRDSLALNLIFLFHLAAISLWIGILSPLRTLALDLSSIEAATDLGQRFGQAAAVFVPLLILAGGYMSYLLVGSISAMIGSDYGQGLLIKIACVAGLLGLAAANKLRFVPRMETGDRAAAQQLARTISFEWIMIGATLVATAVLTSALSLPI